MTYNRNYHGPAKFVDCKKWVEYYPTGRPKPEAKNPWLIVAPNLNEKFRTVPDWDDDPHEDHETFVDILPEAWR